MCIVCFTVLHLCVINNNNIYFNNKTTSRSYISFKGYGKLSINVFLSWRNVQDVHVFITNVT